MVRACARLIQRDRVLFAMVLSCLNRAPARPGRALGQDVYRRGILPHGATINSNRSSDEFLERFALVR
jgi:hypothetical protein